MVAALIGVCSGLLIVLISLLIAMTTRQGTKIDKVVEALTFKLDCEEYKEDMKIINLKLEKHDQKILRVMIYAKMIDAKDDGNGND